MDKMQKPQATERNETWGNSLGVIIDSIKREVHDSGVKSLTSRPREYRVTKNISAQQLQQLSDLTFETYLTEHNAGLTLLTGTKDTALPIDVNNPRDIDRFSQTRIARESRFTLHNHPDHPARPSTGDLNASYGGKSEIEFIVAKDGLAIHKSRAWDDSVHESTSYGAMLASIIGGKYEVNRALKKGLIDMWLPWGDPRIDVVCAYINGTESWAGYAKLLETDADRLAA